MSDPMGLKKLSAGDEEKLREIIDLETPDLAVVDTSDASVRLVLSFLEKIGAVNFKARLGGKECRLRRSIE